MPFCHTRSIRFEETDAAGVMYFANLLALCHEAYEASLAAAGFDLRQFFSDASNPDNAIAVPIVHTAADFYRPLYCGDRVTVCLSPRQLGPDSFEIDYRLQRDAQSLARALTRHVCIQARSRQRCPLTTALLDWLRLNAEPA
ncbi:acyl-CoA thioesterase [Romeria aff. gracilis LEGE 07310]|uniref:1,4-dihydroxy-2-naphthoyl-CoA hydrolase n=1 Tax=Vasconcelosia minhoensis LEGE 07310 TaxID=915328 RepID=A0A8J7DCX2_9CYAN|nr:thioesterase family protein [Romeria gracilis]MBE9078128.1 acyl-CoA thioesterase [Romeria aff. gracilis LEGE 07310]